MDIHESSQQNSSFIFRRNLGMAILASCAVTIPYYFLMRAEAVEDYQRLDFPNWGDLFLLSAFPIAYILVGILLWWWRDTFIGRKVPHWISVALIGSILLTLLVNIFVQVRDGYSRFPSARGLLWIALFTLVISAYVAVFTVLVYYSFSKLKILK